MIFEKKYLSYDILLTNHFHCLAAIISWDIGRQYVYHNCLLTRFWRHNESDLDSKILFLSTIE